MSQPGAREAESVLPAGFSQCPADLSGRFGRPIPPSPGGKRTGADAREAVLAAADHQVAAVRRVRCGRPIVVRHVRRRQPGGRRMGAGRDGVSWVGARRCPESLPRWRSIPILEHRAPDAVLPPTICILPPAVGRQVNDGST